MIRFAVFCAVLPACGKTQAPPLASPPVPAAATAGSFYATPFEKMPNAAQMTALGRRLFFDKGLSASGQLACASCHDPKFAFGPANALPVQLGGAAGNLPGLRAVPSLTYQQSVPPFSEHFQDDDGDDSIDQGPAGGRDWDGRASSAHEQASAPLLSEFEMANIDAAAVVAKVRRADYAQTFREAFGTQLFDDPVLAYKAVLMVLEVFQQSPAEFYPYTSKYDAYLRHQAALSAQEARGLKLFNDSVKGNCASCHPSGIKQSAFPQFTDYGHIAIGVPRNARIKANEDPAYFDLGLCGPLRKDLSDHPGYCGRFKTPSLRNVALRQSFFHNGSFSSLKDVLEFYSKRDTNPEKFYPRDSHGSVLKFDDLPMAYRANLNSEPPFNRHPGDKPVLSESEIDDLIAFLKTLTDGSRAEAFSSAQAASGGKPS